MPAPTVTVATPNFGSVNGGATITLTGTDFTGTTGVTIGGVAATNVVIVSATSITLTAPAGSAGTASILVTNGSGTNAGNTLFFYTGTGTPTDTFIYLKGGRGDGYVPLWTGQFSDALVDENSEPYRNIFQTSATTTMTVVAGPVNGTITFPGVLEGIENEGVVTGGMPKSILTTSPGVLSDEAAGTEPRQFVKVASWRSYLSSNGLWYHFRLADILGVGSLSRDN